MHRLVTMAAKELHVKRDFRPKNRLNSTDVSSKKMVKNTNLVYLATDNF